MARNRYGWQKRAKEIARKQKNDDKMKRRQGKAPLPEALGADAVGMEGRPETEALEAGFPAGPSQPD